MDNTITPWVQLLEKVFWTFVQVYVAAVLAAGSLDFTGSLPWIVAGIAAALTVLANGIPELTGLPFGLDLLYRLTRTFVVSWASLFAGALAALVIAPGDDLRTVAVMVTAAASAAAWGAIPAVLTVIKGLAAHFLPGGTGSAALLPSKVDVAPDQFAVAA
jgi:hypothetical protein